MEVQKCNSCLTKKPTLSCGLCQAAICKGCAEFLETSESFTYLTKIPAELAHSVYCGPCFDQHVAPALLSYNETLERAKNVQVYDKTQGKETRLIKREKEFFTVRDCPDYEDALLRLAFMAAEANYNSLIGVDLKYEKVKIGTYTTTKWSGTAIPTNLEPNRAMKDRSLWHNPN